MTVEQLHACDSPARVGLGSSAQYNSFPAIGPVPLPQREDDDLRGRCRLRRQDERGRLAPEGSGTRSRGTTLKFSPSLSPESSPSLSPESSPSLSRESSPSLSRESSPSLSRESSPSLSRESSPSLSRESSPFLSREFMLFGEFLPSCRCTMVGTVISCQTPPDALTPLPLAWPGAVSAV